MQNRRLGACFVLSARGQQRALNQSSIAPIYDDLIASTLKILHIEPQKTGTAIASY